jgi:hypothetical protein
MQNKIDATLSAASVTKILQFIDQIEAEMPFLVDLSNDEIASLNKMGDKGQSFVQDAMTLAEQDDSFLPRSFEVTAMRRDVDLTRALPPITARISRLKELLVDTEILVGSDAFSAALEVYQSAQRNGKGAGLKDSVSSLSKRFTRKSKKKTPDEEPPKT